MKVLFCANKIPSRKLVGRGAEGSKWQVRLCYCNFARCSIIVSTNPDFAKLSINQSINGGFLFIALTTYCSAKNRAAPTFTSMFKPF
jgi:hypothetical protein